MPRLFSSGFFFLAFLVFPHFGWSQDVLDVHGAHVTEDEVRISWQVNCESENVPEYILIRYNRSLVLANEGEVWIVSEPTPYTQGYAVLKNLDASANYVYQVGYPQVGNSVNEIIWTTRDQFQTKMPWGITRFLLMVGALSLFIYGMKTMSEGIQASAGVRLRKILNRMTKNRFTGVLSGFVITGILQSSSATTVMTVSFVNAGLITLAESAGLMMGANIGTTVTGWLVSLLGFRINIAMYALIIFAAAIPFLLSKKSEVRSWSTALIGFALLFLGLGFLKDTVPDFTEDSVIVQFFIEYSNIPVLGSLMFIALGIIITVIVQSSSSAITLTMALCASGVIPFEVAAAMILGENIGTTATAEIAALVGNVHAKRSARIHTLFNVFGTIWMIFALPFVLRAIGNFMPADPFENSESGRQAATTALAAFHSVFNIVNFLILIWFTDLLVKIASKTVRSKGSEDEEYRLEFIDSSIQISEISLLEARKQVIRFAEITERMGTFVKSLLTETDATEQRLTFRRIQKYEKITDRFEIEISQYCSRLSTTELSSNASQKVRAILGVSNELERIGDIFYQMSNTIERKTESRIWFTPDQREKLLKMFAKVETALDFLMENLKKEEEEVIDLAVAKEQRDELRKSRNRMRKEYISQIESGKFNLQSGTVYNDLFASLEKVGEHILNANEALVEGA